MTWILSEYIPNNINKAEVVSQPYDLSLYRSFLVKVRLKELKPWNLAGYVNLVSGDDGGVLYQSNKVLLYWENLVTVDFRIKTVDDSFLLPGLIRLIFVPIWWILNQDLDYEYWIYFWQ